MMRYILCLMTSLLVSISLQAQKEKDFVAQFMDDISPASEVADSGQKDYECVTVSPSMLDKVLRMMRSKDNKDNEQFEKVLPHVKSLRIFTATRHSDKYNDEAVRLLGKNSKEYKPFKADAKNTKKPCIWVRKNGVKVIEMVMLNRKDDDNFQIVNITGDMNKEFVNDLLKM